jgi:hypothetical protein
VENVDGKSKGTMLGHHHMGTILLNLTQLVRCQMRGIRKCQPLHQIMRNKIILVTIVEDEHDQGLLDLEIVSKQRC